MKQKIAAEHRLLRGVLGGNHLDDHEELARRLYAGLRELDAQGATVIFCPLPKNEGLGTAMRDRLFRAAR